jgi:zinc transport system substrate-binding protein
VTHAAVTPGAALALLLACSAPGATGAATAEAIPKVVASIQPVHSLVAGVMEGVGTPSLLVAPGASPHAYQMRPSEAKALAGADLVVWVGEELEAFLAKPVASLGGSARTLELMEAPGVELLPTREGGAWDEHDHHGDEAHESQNEPEHHEEEEEHAAEGRNEHGGHDAHIWLSPANARAIVQAVAAALAEVDPARAGRYAANAEAVTARLGALEAEMRARLEPVRERPYVVFHDAYHYLEHAFGLNAAGSITVSPERQPSAARLAELRERIRREGAACVFGEPQVATKLVATVVEGTKAGVGELDAEGSGRIAPGPDAYFTLMRRNAKALSDCLSKQS